MRTTKRSFRTFRYRECDAFAKYLEKQAANGWHFKEWHLGLVFEKGEPKDVRYAVEVFPKGDERDTRPEKDAEEYAEYCAAAGWKLIDGQKKFCIFRQTGKDAVPIVTPKERFENIKKAERSRLYFPLYMIPLALFCFWIVWADIAKMGFQSYVLLLTGMAILIAILSVIDCVAALLLIWKQKRILADGEIPFYGKGFGWISEKSIYILCIVTCILAYVLRPKQSATDIALVFVQFASTIGIALTAVFASVFRPSIKRRMHVYWGICILVMGGAFIAFLYFLNTEQTEAVPTVNAPLVQGDYRETEGTLSSFGNEYESILGRKYDYYVSYEKGLVQDRIRYEVYESPYDWVLDRVWTQRWAVKEETTDCRELWDAEEAWISQPKEFYVEKYYYEVRYPDQVILFWTRDELGAEDVKIIREKLEKWQENNFKH